MKYILGRLLIMAAITAVLVEAAYIERGYFAIGIEWAFVSLVLIIREGLIGE